MSGADEEEWVKSALSNDAMVGELLVHLHRSPPPPPPHLPLKLAALPLEWTVRQPRSKSVSGSKNLPAHRASPTTPLSWSGATSISGGSGGGFEESSRLNLIKRSKDNDESGKSTSKKSRKKKTLPELRQEESFLIKERRDLKRELTILRLNLEQERATNEKFKRMKLELKPELERSTNSIEEESIFRQKSNNVALEPCALNTFTDGNAASGSKFVLPDLNMPFEDHSSDVICGVS